MKMKAGGLGGLLFCEGGKTADKIDEIQICLCHHLDFNRNKQTGCDYQIGIMG